MNEQQLVAVKQALETLQDFADDIRHDNEQDEIGCRSCCGVLSYDNHSENCKAMKSIAALQSIISQDALDKMAENARELGLDYEPAVQEKCFLCGERVDSCASDVCPKSAQPAVQEPVAWVNHGENRITRATGWDGYGALYTTPPAPQPVPVKTYHDGKPWPVAPKPWVGLTDEERNECTQSPFTADQHRAIEAKLKEKNHG
jgi:hypothetical protein